MILSRIYSKFIMGKAVRGTFLLLVFSMTVSMLTIFASLQIDMSSFSAKKELVIMAPSIYNNTVQNLIVKPPISTERYEPKQWNRVDPILSHGDGSPSLTFGPRIFNNLTNNLARGANIMTSISGCHLAAWVYNLGTKQRNQDCGAWRSDNQAKINLRDDAPFPDIQPYDTIYVHPRMMSDFSRSFLPRLKVPIVVISGSYDNSRQHRLSYKITKSILDNPMVEYWFCQNILNTTGLTSLLPKLGSFALGIEPFDKNPNGVNPVVILRDEVLRQAAKTAKKTIDVFEAYTSPYTNPNRLNVPRGIKLPLPEYFQYLAKSKFVLSPSGHKPDCFRHYEALAFGAIPVTDLPEGTYGHLEAGPVVFGTKQWWNLTEAELLNNTNLTSFPDVNRNMIFEEYWLEDMERRVGRPLRWFDIRHKRRSFLSDFYMNYSEIKVITDMAWADFSNDSSATMAKFQGEKKGWKTKGWPMPYM